jgi:hypothetical protein
MNINHIVHEESAETGIGHIITTLHSRYAQDTYVQCPPALRHPPQGHIFPLHVTSMHHRLQDWPHALCFITVEVLMAGHTVNMTENRN